VGGSRREATSDALSIIHDELFGGLDMAELIRIGSPQQSNGKAHVVFVHGLGGHPENTWMSNINDAASLWPKWVAEDSGCEVWLMGYDAGLSRWLDGAMPLTMQGTAILDALASEPRLKDQKLVLIGHSLGGLVIKMALSNGMTHGVKRYQELIRQVVGVVLIATPQFGSQLALLAQAFKFVTRSNEPVSDLRAHNPHLIALNAQFRAIASELNLPVRSFSETRGVSSSRRFLGFLQGPTVTVVTLDSSDPHIQGETAIALPEDHFSICKPTSRSSQIHKSLIDFLSKVDVRERVKDENQNDRAEADTVAILRIDGVELTRGIEQGPVLAKIEININGHRIVYPSYGGVSWMEIGPTMSPGSFPLNSPNPYVIHFLMWIQLPDGATKKLTNQMPERENYFPIAGSSSLHYVQDNIRIAEISAVVRYSIIATAPLVNGHSIRYPF
jgi:pimeloyl-ACP methyl ester carboxylesterase